MIGIESSHMVSYWLLIVTMHLGNTIKELWHVFNYFNAFLMRNDKVPHDLYRGQTDLGVVQHVDL